MSKPPAPFPAFGGKSTVASAIWQRLGRARNIILPVYDGRRELDYGYDYVEPFGNSLAVLLANPDYDWDTGRWRVANPPIETVNDLDPFIANFWRAVKSDPVEVARFADWPVSEADLHARHRWLVDAGQRWFRDRMLADPDFYDTKIAGWWVWGVSSWLGRRWCTLDGETLYHTLPKLGTAGNGINRRSLRLAGVDRISALETYFVSFANRLRDVRVACGDWSRVVSHATTVGNSGASGSSIAIVFDPPYGADRDEVYAVDSFHVAADVRKWCLAEMVDPTTPYRGPRYRHPRVRIALCGYNDEHDAHLPDDWERVHWVGPKGYAKAATNTNRFNETIWFSPACIRPSAAKQATLW